VVHDFAHWRVRLIGDFYQVQAGLLGAGQSLGKRNNSELFAVDADKSDLSGTNPFIDSLFGTGMGSYCRSLT